MARQVAQFVLLLVVLCESGGQSTTSVDSRCVYTFNVPASECGQTPDSNTDVEVVKSLAVGLQAQIKQLVYEVRQLRDDNVKMKQQLAGRCYPVDTATVWSNDGVSVMSTNSYLISLVNVT